MDVCGLGLLCSFAENPHFSSFRIIRGSGPCISITYSSALLITLHGIAKRLHSHPSQSILTISAITSSIGITFIWVLPVRSPLLEPVVAIPYVSSSINTPYGWIVALVMLFNFKLNSTYSKKVARKHGYDVRPSAQIKLWSRLDMPLCRPRFCP